MKCQHRVEIPEFSKTKSTRKFEFENSSFLNPPSPTVFARNFKFQISKMKPPTSDCPRAVLVLGSAVCVAHKRIIFVKPALLWGFLVHYSAVVGSCWAPAPLLSQTRYRSMQASAPPASCHTRDGCGMSPCADKYQDFFSIWEL